MYKRKIKLIAVIVHLLLYTGFVNAQTTGQAISSEQARAVLDSKYGLDQRLVSGKSYPGEPQGSIVGHPYWISPEWKTGSVCINGVTFSGLLLRYDISEGELVLNTSNISRQSIQLCLNINDISEFTLDERRFIVFPGKEINDGHKFCELCAEGPLRYVVTRSKSVGITSSGSSDFSYKEITGNYLLYNDRIIKYTSKRALYKLFPAYKKELRKFVYSHSLSFSRKNTVNRALLVEYCNSLINQS